MSIRTSRARLVVPRPTSVENSELDWLDWLSFGGADEWDEEPALAAIIGGHGHARGHDVEDNVLGKLSTGD